MTPDLILDISSIPASIVSEDTGELSGRRRLGISSAGKVDLKRAGVVLDHLREERNRYELAKH